MSLVASILLAEALTVGGLAGLVETPAEEKASAPAEASAVIAVETAAPTVEKTVEPAEVVVVSAPGADAAVEDRKADGKKAAAPRTVKVTSDRSQYLRKDGVIAFDGHVFVDDVEFQMHADEVTIFLQGTNELKRVVAIGNVVVTNELRSGSCAKATYNKGLSKVVLYGDEKAGILARLQDDGKRKSSVEGRKITFWIDTEQVEVEGSTVTVDASGTNAKDGVKNLFNK